ncbi:MAG: hypothetical protein Q8941_01365 [Bacteroidota bacterium]|nr:hypothetical protein [Bacteroidota bacterium]
MNALKNFQLFFIIAVVLSSCNSCKTTPNSNDKTPPTIDWTVDDKTSGAETKVNGSGSVSVKHGDNLTITACVNDDGGVKELKSSSNFGYSCSGNGIGQNVGPSLGVIETTPLGLDANGKAWSRYCKFFTFSTGFTCSEGLNYSSGGYSLNLEGKNFANLSASATLTINVKP